MRKILDFLSAVFQPDTFATFFNYAIKIVLNPLVIIAVPFFLQECVQGYWYTFGSLAALTTFADLGFTTIMTQFAAHEYAYLSLSPQSKRFAGDTYYCLRLASLFRFVTKWICLLLSAAAVIIFLIGVSIFSVKNDGVNWFMPWIVYVLGTVLNFAVQIILSFYEGCNQFAITQKIRTAESVAHCVVTLFLLATGAGLYSLGLAMCVKATVGFLLFLRSFWVSAKQMTSKHEERIHVPWLRDILPLLWRYALSWVSGYLAMQIYNPLTFMKYGSVTAGKVGYCLSIISAIFSVANVWDLTAVPKYNIMVEKKEWIPMDHLLKRNIIYALITYSLGIAALWTVGKTSILRPLIWDKMLGDGPALVLTATLALSIITSALASYLRAHKKEPFMWLSIMNGGISAALTLLFCELFSVEYIFCGYFIANVIALPTSYLIWKRCIKLWHCVKL